MARTVNKVWLPLIPIALWACSGTGTEKAPDFFYSGKADDGRLQPVQVGPLELGTTQTLRYHNQVPVLRVESYGNTILELELSGKQSSAMLRVKGPLPGDGDDLSPDSIAGVPVVAEASGSPARLTVNLAQPGVYNVLAREHASASDQELELTSACKQSCFRQAINQRQMLTLLDEAGKLDQVVQLFGAQLNELVADPETRKQLLAKLSAIIKQSATWEGLERFPTIPLKQLGLLRPVLIEGSGSGAPQPSTATKPEVITGELSALLGPCDGVPRASPKPVHPSMPEIARGHFPNRALTRCQVSRSVSLAKILTSLAADNGSCVEVQSKTATTPRQLFELLIETGHRVLVRNERTYANFIALTLAGMDVIWPVWIDTGIQLSDGSSLTIPTGHSHHAWRVAGPLVDTRVTFYLGIDGVAFFSQTQARPGWTGMAIEHLASTEEGQHEHETVLKSLDLAAAVQRRLHKERDLYAPKMPADGYGFLGVCNDSTAVIEHAAWQTITTFPLVRSASLKEKPQLGDGLDSTLQALPSDTDAPAPRQDALRRILSMSPHHPDSYLVVDDLLRAQLRAVMDEVAVKH